jgi:ATP synthase protein I
MTDPEPNGPDGPPAAANGSAATRPDYGLEPPPEPLPEPTEEEDPGAVLREYRRVMYQYSFIGIELGVAVAIGVLLGRWLDEKWGTAPWMMLAGVALGLTAAGKDLVRLVRRAKKKG